MLPRRRRTPTLFPYTTLFRSQGFGQAEQQVGSVQGGVIHLLAAAEQAGEVEDLGQVMGILDQVGGLVVIAHGRSEEHTSELQSRGHLVCRLLLEKKKSREQTE